MKLIPLLPAIRVNAAVLNSLVADEGVEVARLAPHDPKDAVQRLRYYENLQAAKDESRRLHIVALSMVQAHPGEALYNTMFPDNIVTVHA